MKKIIVLSLLLGFTANYCYASNLNEVMYGIRGGIEILSDVNRLQGQVNQTNAQKQELERKQNLKTNPVQTNQNSYTPTSPKNTANYYNMQSRDEGTAFTAKTKFAEGNIYLRQGKYREAIDNYYEAKELFESIGNTENAQKAMQAYNTALEMRCEFGDYCY